MGVRLVVEVEIDGGETDAERATYGHDLVAAIERRVESAVDGEVITFEFKARQIRAVTIENRR